MNVGQNMNAHCFSFFQTFYYFSFVLFNLLIMNENIIFGKLENKTKQKKEKKLMSLSIINV